METTKPSSSLEVLPAQTVVGTWKTELTLRDCATGTSLKVLRVMDVFSIDGALIETGAEITSGFAGPAHGTWRDTGSNSYVAVLKFFRSVGDGSVAEMQRITRHLHLNHDGSQFTGTACIETFDSYNRLTLTQCATEVAVRLI